MLAMGAALLVAKAASVPDDTAMLAVGTAALRQWHSKFAHLAANIEVIPVNIADLATNIAALADIAAELPGDIADQTVNL